MLSTNFSSENLCQGALTSGGESLFPSYLFIPLGQGNTTQGLVPIRSTKGGSCLVSLGGGYVAESLVDVLRVQEVSVQALQMSLPGGCAVCAGVEGIFQVAEWESCYRLDRIVLEAISLQVAVVWQNRSVCCKCFAARCCPH